MTKEKYKKKETKKEEKINFCPSKVLYLYIHNYCYILPFLSSSTAIPRHTRNADKTQTSCPTSAQKKHIKKHIQHITGHRD